jgi:hypothetical protein
MILTQISNGNVNTHTYTGATLDSGSDSRGGQESAHLRAAAPRGGNIRGTSPFPSEHAACAR